MTTGDLINKDFGEGGFQFTKRQQFVSFSSFYFTKVEDLGGGNYKCEFLVTFSDPIDTIKVYAGTKFEHEGIIYIGREHIIYTSLFLYYDTHLKSVPKGYLTMNSEEFEKYHRILHSQR